MGRSIGKRWALQGGSKGLRSGRGWEGKGVGRRGEGGPNERERLRKCEAEVQGGKRGWGGSLWPERGAAVTLCLGRSDKSGSSS